MYRSITTPRVTTFLLDTGSPLQEKGGNFNAVYRIVNPVPGKVPILDVMLIWEFGKRHQPEGLLTRFPVFTNTV